MAPIVPVHVSTGNFHQLLWLHRRVRTTTDAPRNRYVLTTHVLTPLFTCFIHTPSRSRDNSMENYHSVRVRNGRCVKQKEDASYIRAHIRATLVPPPLPSRGANTGGRSRVPRASCYRFNGLAPTSFRSDAVSWWRRRSPAGSWRRGYWDPTPTSGSAPVPRWASSRDQRRGAEGEWRSGRAAIPWDNMPPSRSPSARETRSAVRRSRRPPRVHRRRRRRRRCHHRRRRHHRCR